MSLFRRPARSNIPPGGNVIQFAQVRFADVVVVIFTAVAAEIGFCDRCGGEVERAELAYNGAVAVDQWISNSGDVVSNLSGGGGAASKQSGAPLSRTSGCARKRSLEGNYKWLLETTMRRDQIERRGLPFRSGPSLAPNLFLSRSSHLRLFVAAHSIVSLSVGTSCRSIYLDLRAAAGAL